MSNLKSFFRVCFFPKKIMRLFSIELILNNYITSVLLPISYLPKIHTLVQCKFTLINMILSVSNKYRFKCRLMSEELIQLWLRWKYWKFERFKCTMVMSKHNKQWISFKSAWDLHESHSVCLILWGSLCPHLLIQCPHMRRMLANIKLIASF